LAIRTFENSGMGAVCSWPVRWDVHYVEQTASTNSDLLALARAGAPAGTVLRAGHQTAGRGRLGRTWKASPGSSLLASILLDTEPVPFVTVSRVALAASDACRHLAGVEAALKWPNDLVVGDRKLAGLLAESDGGPTVVVGIGCNVRRPPSAAGPPEAVHPLGADLSAAPGPVPGPGALLDELLERLDRWLDRTPDEVLAAYRSRCATLGRDVRVVLPGQDLEGRAAGITPAGELEVVVGGVTRVVRAGDVVHVRGR
jgi:BirA family biotin operon repressor/biotin-[acetyl-CoA-carboxylase] ligase